VNILSVIVDKVQIDNETASVWWYSAFGTIGAWTLSEVNTLITTLILLGTLIFTWKKALKSDRNLPKICRSCINGKPPKTCPYPDNARPFGCPHTPSIE